MPFSDTHTKAFRIPASQATNQLSKNYKPFLWRRLRAKPFVTGLLNCTEDVPKYRSSGTGTPIMMFGETDLRYADASDLLEKRKVTSAYQWEWYAAKKKQPSESLISRIGNWI
jgi:hypothetical protein